MGLVARRVRRGKRLRSDDPAVVARAFVEIDDGQEIGRLARLIAGADEQVARFGIGAALTVGCRSGGRAVPLSTAGADAEQYRGDPCNRFLL